MKKRIFAKVFILCIFIAIFVAALSLTSCLESQTPTIALPDNLQSQQQTIQSTISVTGQGKVKTLPDEVFIDISVITERPTTQEAVDLNSQISKDVMDAVNKINAKNLKIQTITYELNPLYDYSKENQPPTIYAYQVINTIEARTTELEKISEIIAKATEKGASRITNIGFDLTEEAKMNAKNEALAQATADANNKALAIAKPLGLTIDKILYINESETSFPGPLFAPTGFGKFETAQDVAPPVVMPQEIEVTASISVVYLFKK